MSAKSAPGTDAVKVKGVWQAHRYLILRRIAQLGFLALFLTGPWLGIWITKGTLASSRTFDILPLTDPLVFLQALAAHHAVEGLALIGAVIVTAAYVLAGGRSYCAWVCPINPVTDLAHWLREKLGIDKGWQPKGNPRLWLLGTVLLLSAAAGEVAWELVNPITYLHRALVFGGVLAWSLPVAVFMLDLLIARRGWCGHLCPVGAFYGLLGRGAVLRVSAVRRDACNDCLDCFAVCPEPKVIAPALRGARAGTGPLILAGDCTNCGRCIDVCSQSVFRFTHRFDAATIPQPAESVQGGVP